MKYSAYNLSNALFLRYILIICILIGILHNLSAFAKNTGSDDKKFDVTLLNDIFVMKLSEDIWIIDKRSAHKAFKDAGFSLHSVIKNLEPRYKIKEGLSLKVDSELGVFIFNRKGLYIQSLTNIDFAERIGIKEGDLVKDVNSYPLNSIVGVYKIYKQVDDAKVKLVSVNIVRDGQTKTFIYKAK